MQGVLTAAVFAVALGTGAAEAACDSGQTLVLNCPVSVDKTLNVCIGGGTASYAFGPHGAPELALTLPLADVGATPWPGIGRSIWEEIVFPNNDVQYVVWISLDRMDEARPVSGGVVVRRGEKQLAELPCLEGSAQVGVFAISDGFADAGYCWNFEAQAWSRSCTN